PLWTNFFAEQRISLETTPITANPVGNGRSPHRRPTTPRSRFPSTAGTPRSSRVPFQQRSTIGRAATFIPAGKTARSPKNSLARPRVQCGCGTVPPLGTAKFAAVPGPRGSAVACRTGEPVLDRAADGAVEIGPREGFGGPQPT